MGKSRRHLQVSGACALRRSAQVVQYQVFLPHSACYLSES